MSTHEFHAEGCSAPELGRLLEDYLVGALPPEQAAAFEEHYFACVACLEAIRVRQSGAHAIVRADRSGLRARWAVAALILVLAACTGLFVVCRRAARGAGEGGSTASLAELSRASPPVYAASAAAGQEEGADGGEFVEAMRAYAAGDFARAVPGLEAARKGDPTCSETGFYLGASYLATNRVDRAIEAFQSTFALEDSEFRERSRFYLAMAYLRREAIDDARRELREVVAGGGSMSRDAQRLLRELDGLARARTDSP